MTVELAVRTTAIPGLLVVDLPVHGDARGWFKESWQRQKMTALGLPDFGPVQNNVSYNAARGTTRGLHAEPWDKLVSLAHGRILGAWVDLREGPTFGAAVTVEMGPEQAVFVPRGVANGYQALADDTVYSYLVNDHWSPEARASYTYLNLADETAAIDWPIPLDQATVSQADAAHPRLADVRPFPRRRTVIIGAGGQLGLALRGILPDAVALAQGDLDLTDADAVAAYPWSGVDTVINAAAYTAVDAAESPEGRVRAWQVNVAATARLVEVARSHRLRLVHVSTDYVFDGRRAQHPEDEPVSPLGVYGQTKAAADALVATLPRHLVVRTSWVIGEGRNFVATMRSLAASGASPAVVDDQVGRLTFASDLARGIVHLLGSDAASGTWNLTCSGPAVSWFDVARRVFELSGRDPDDVRPTSTAAWAAGQAGPVAPRPAHSTLALDKIAATGLVLPTSEDALRAHLGVP